MEENKIIKKENIGNIIIFIIIFIILTFSLFIAIRDINANENKVFYISYRTEIGVGGVEYQGSIRCYEDIINITKEIEETFNLENVVILNWKELK